jgi:DNA-binding NtrC family response regulator
MPSAPEVHEFIGSAAVFASDPMRQLLTQVRKIAATNATALITGESGAGKEVVARAIHHYSGRSSRSWVDINLRSPAGESSRKRAVRLREGSL